MVRLLGWYRSPSGVAFFLALAGVVALSLTLGGAWGALSLAGVVGLFIPLKLMHLEAARLSVGDAQRHLEWKLSRLEKQVAKLGSSDGTNAATKAEIQAVRADALAAVDSARHEWSDILRAERRTTQSAIRSSLTASHAAD